MSSVRVTCWNEESRFGCEESYGVEPGTEVRVTVAIPGEGEVVVYEGTPIPANDNGVILDPDATVECVLRQLVQDVGSREVQAVLAVLLEEGVPGDRDGEEDDEWEGDDGEVYEVTARGRAYSKVVRVAHEMREGRSAADSLAELSASAAAHALMAGLSTILLERDFLVEQEAELETDPTFEAGLHTSRPELDYEAPRGDEPRVGQPEATAPVAGMNRAELVLIDAVDYCSDLSRYDMRAVFWCPESLRPLMGRAVLSVSQVERDHRGKPADGVRYGAWLEPLDYLALWEEVNHELARLGLETTTKSEAFLERVAKAMGWAGAARVEVN